MAAAARPSPSLPFQEPVEPGGLEELGGAVAVRCIAVFATWAFAGPAAVDSVVVVVVPAPGLGSEHPYRILSPENQASVLADFVGVAETDVAAGEVLRPKSSAFLQEGEGQFWGQLLPGLQALHTLARSGYDMVHGISLCPFLFSWADAHP